MVFPRSPVYPLRGAPLHLSVTGMGFVRNQEKEEAMEEEDDKSEESDMTKGKTKEQKTEDRENEKEGNRQEHEEEEEKTERLRSRPASETGALPLPSLRVLSGTDPELGSQLQEAAASGENWSPSTMFPFCGPISLSPPA